MRDVIRLATCFLFTFSLFMASSYVMFNLNEELTIASYDLEVEEKTLPLFNMIISVFQTVFGILTIGLGVAIFLCIIMGSGGREHELYG